MLTKTPDIFPTLTGTRWVIADLADKIGTVHATQNKNPCLRPGSMDRFVANLHKQLGTDYSYGGYSEDRSQLWQGSYLEPDQAVHCGIDLNVPAGTPVVLAHETKILKVMHDTEKFGWGTAVSCELVKPIGKIAGFIIAHMADDIFVMGGQVLSPGAYVGEVGRHAENGWWYQHLHVQAFTQAELNHHGGDIFGHRFDGYDKAASISARFPDPTPLLYRDGHVPR